MNGARRDFSGFDWDAGNVDKCQRHGVSIPEIEEVLARGAQLIVPDVKNSDGDPRYIVIGKTGLGRHLFVVFTLRELEEVVRLRPISARYMHRKEIEKYEQEIARLPKR